MLSELSVRDLGLIEDLSVVLGEGMTALTGETGAGKTMLLEGINLLLGGRADPAMVRAGCGEAVVEGRFTDGNDEVVLRRVVPAEGRSRAYLDGRMATATELAERGAELVDIHGQHDHQSLLAPAVQRAALDQFAGIDLTPMAEARGHLGGLDHELAKMGGDAGARARETDLLGHQVAELSEAAIEDPHEDTALEAAEGELADATAHREAGATAAALIGGDEAAADLVARAEAALTHRAPFGAEADRLSAAVAELRDLAGTLERRAAEISDDPERLAEVRHRRALLAELRRKYGSATLGDQPGDGTLAAVIAYRETARQRLAELENHDQIAARLEAERAEAAAHLATQQEAVGRARRAAAPELADAVGSHLADLALGDARIEVEVGAEEPGDAVRFLLAANRGAPLLALARAASGGELSRAMLALRLVLTSAPPTLIFDEVDAGIGGEAALAVGRALAAIGTHHQVLVVTHLAQVAAHAHHQVQVTRADRATTTVATARSLSGDDRVVELSRMLSGTPDSPATRDAAAALLAEAADHSERRALSR